MSTGKTQLVVTPPDLKDGGKKAVARIILASAAQLDPFTAALSTVYGYTYPSDFERDLERFRLEVAQKLTDHEEQLNNLLEYLSPRAVISDVATRWYQREAGGQLFARFNGDRIVVEEATGPRRTDRRTRTVYLPDRAAEQAEILDRRARGPHYVGDWHTHPERYPCPSSPDAQSIADCVAKSIHELNGFVLVIVGQAEPPAGLHVSVHDGNTSFPLRYA